MKSTQTTHTLVRIAAVALLVLPSLSCEHFEYSKYDTFDDWYVGRENTFDPLAISCGCSDRGFWSYLFNNVIVQTPIYVGYEAFRYVALPVALPYYGVARLVGSDDTPPPSDSGTSPDDDSSSSGEASSRTEPSNDSEPANSAEQSQAQ